MIVDRIENCNAYYLGKAWQVAFEFLLALKLDVEDKKYHIQGDDMFAIVASYKTRPADIAQFETHRKYVDIQAVMSGSEEIGWLPVGGLLTKQPYDASKDIEFYHHPNANYTRINVSPGTFVALFPQDAHKPSLMIGNAPECVKKVVIKINANLLSAQGR
ncbi:MAG: YhcH/YjgK/YiaL family protein [Planctomycetes bacterium]|nr:YhcH/YjgK/YiaL family protein [Planctomycetota bacterium]